MFYVKSPINNSTMNKQTVIPNHSSLHKTNSNNPSQSQIPRKQVPTGRIQITGTDVSIESSVVSSFLKSVNAKESSSNSNPQPKPNSPVQPVLNSSHLYKTQQNIKVNQTSPETTPAFNHLGLKKTPVNSVLNKIKNFDNNCVNNDKKVEKEETVVLRTRSNPLENKIESTNRTSDLEDKKWKAKYEEAEKRRKELLTESQKCKFEVESPPGHLQLNDSSVYNDSTRLVTKFSHFV